MKHEVESDNLIVNQLTFIMSLYKIVQQFEFLTFPATFMKSKRCLQLLQWGQDKYRVSICTDNLTESINDKILVL